MYKSDTIFNISVWNPKSINVEKITATTITMLTQIEIFDVAMYKLNNV